MALFNKVIKKISDAVKGLFFALKTDLSFRLDIIVGFFLLVLWYIAKPLTETESLFLFLSWILVLITELQNTALETALDKIHPERHDDIGRSKDMAAASVVISFAFVVTVVAVIIFSRM